MMNKDRHAGFIEEDRSFTRCGINSKLLIWDCLLFCVVNNVFYLNIVRYFSLVFCVTPFGDRIMLKSIRNCDNNLTKLRNDVRVTTE